MVHELLLCHQQGAICHHHSTLLQGPPDVWDPWQRYDPLLNGLNAGLAVHALYLNPDHRLNIQTCVLNLQDQVSLCDNRSIIVHLDQVSGATADRQNSSKTGDPAADGLGPVVRTKARQPKGSSGGGVRWTVQIALAAALVCQIIESMCRKLSIILETKDKQLWRTWILLVKNQRDRPHRDPEEPERTGFHFQGRAHWLHWSRTPEPGPGPSASGLHINYTSGASRVVSCGHMTWPVVLQMWFWLMSTDTPEKPLLGPIPLTMRQNSEDCPSR